ncbi:MULTISPECIES: hypothetical protein [unclassified Mesorhizobium]|nr:MULTISPECIES: hypothetical protein [unclassified Mesorhizobium]
MNLYPTQIVRRVVPSAPTPRRRSARAVLSAIERVLRGRTDPKRTMNG